MTNKKRAAGAGTPNSAIALRCGSSSCLTKSIVDRLQKGKRAEFAGQHVLSGLSNGET